MSCFLALVFATFSIKVVTMSAEIRKIEKNTSKTRNSFYPAEDESSRLVLLKSEQSDIFLN